MCESARAELNFHFKEIFFASSWRMDLGLRVRVGMRSEAKIRSYHDSVGKK